MKTSTTLTLTATVILSAHALAQSSGTSHPELLSDNPSTPASAITDHYVPPSHTAVATATSPAPAASFTVVGPPVAVAPDTPIHAAAILHRTEPTPIVTDDLNSGIVSAVPVGPNELAPATILKANLGEDISTKATLAGTNFTAILSQSAGHDGRILLPVGTLIHGRVTQIHGGRRIGGNSAIRLQPDTITLPDGTTYRLAAEVVDLDHFQDSHVNSEGTIVANGHHKVTAAALGLTTGSAVIAGALIGGGVGAVVGLGVGAGIGAVWWLRRDRQQLLPAGTQIVFSLDAPLVLNPGSSFGHPAQ